MMTSIFGKLFALFGWTRTFEPDDDVPGQSFDVINMCLKVGYSRRDINIMYTNFKKLDIYNKNKVLFASFCQLNRIDNPLGEFLFRKILAIGKKEDIDFQNYLICIWDTFSICDNHSIAKLVFQLFDSDNSGSLSFLVIKSMVKLMYGEETPRYRTVLFNLIDKVEDQSKEIFESDFVQLTLELPALLYPIFEHLRIVKKNTLGVDRWDQIRTDTLTIARRKSHSKALEAAGETIASIAENEEISRILEKANQIQGNRQLINYLNKIESTRPRKNLSLEQPNDSQRNEIEERVSITRSRRAKTVASPIDSERISGFSPSIVQRRRLSNFSSNASNDSIENSRRLSNASSISIPRRQRNLSNVSDISNEISRRDSNASNKSQEKRTRKAPKGLSASLNGKQRSPSNASSKSRERSEVRSRGCSNASDISLEDIGMQVPRSKPEGRRSVSSTSSRKKISPLNIDSDIAKMAKLSKVREMLSSRDSVQIQLL